MSESFFMKPAAKWVTPIGAAVVGFACCCCGMFAVNTGYLYYLTDGNIPQGFERGAELGARLGQQNPLFGLTSIALYCLPPVFMLIAAAAGYFWVDRQQKQNAPPPSQPMA